MVRGVGGDGGGVTSWEGEVDGCGEVDGDERGERYFKFLSEYSPCLLESA